MSRRKICVVTGSRAEYGLLYWLMKEIEANKNLELQLIATGMHLSSEFGMTYREIEKDFKIDKKIKKPKSAFCF
jgi:GDP/UDP-N,N'-diacetylbacillosamine 2-epimerase (hydrolysing)